MFGDKLVGLGIGLDGYDNFFQQGGFLFVYFVLGKGYCLTPSNLKYLFGGGD